MGRHADMCCVMNELAQVYS